MDQHETPLEMAQRRVVEAEARVADQTARVADLRRRGLDTKQAASILAMFVETLRLMREDLAYEQQKRSRHP